MYNVPCELEINTTSLIFSKT